MKAYLGFDLGTTNVKASVICGNGEIEEVITRKTPVLRINGVRYYDLSSVEREVEEIVHHFSTKFELAAISFTSIGESVVPMRDTRSLHPPLMWDEQVTMTTYEKVGETTERYAGYGRAGVVNDYRFAIYKILWMRETLDLGEVDCWVPISSYFLFKYTGNIVWAESQACRSYLYDIHQRTWNAELVSFFGLEGKLGEIAYTGTLGGIDGDGKIIGVAGHDHITGMYGMYVLSDYNPFFYDSMGTSSVLGAVLTIRNAQKEFPVPFFKGVSGVLGAAFEENRYYIQNSFRYFGYLMERIAVFSGNRVDRDFYTRINSEIEALPNANPKAYFSIGGDCLLGVKKDKVNILNFPIDIQPAELMQSAYVYLCAMSRMIYESLGTFCSSDVDFFAGGRIVSDTTFMKYKASMLGRPITVFDTDELTALGASIAAITAAQDEGVIQNLKDTLQRRIIEPDPKIKKHLNEAYEKYSVLGASPILDYFT